MSVIIKRCNTCAGYDEIDKQWCYFRQVETEYNCYCDKWEPNKELYGSLVERIKRGEFAVCGIDPPTISPRGWDKNEEATAELLRLAEIGERMQWVPVSERLPEDASPVLAAVKSGKRVYVIRAGYSRKFQLPCDTDCDEEFLDYDEKTDEYYCKEGWYEDNRYEEIHWGVDGDVTHWMPLPEPPNEGGGE